MYGYIHVNDHYLNLLLDNLSKEVNKTIFLLGGSNTDLLNFDTSIIFCMIQPLISYNPSLFYRPEYLITNKFYAFVKSTDLKICDIIIGIATKSYTYAFLF